MIPQALRKVGGAGMLGCKADVIPPSLFSLLLYPPRDQTALWGAEDKIKVGLWVFLRFICIEMGVFTVHRLENSPI